ncbi:hypothetical protein TNCT_585601 [Trichonephila clavata]|uniref:Uncharacterized protein n=1 Tax=Trichonephila clavata TaxID=2740835 RepID=A0A8X6HDY3_TRICU|nr:hypothetical protein TNCT_585601 [Trichonephila clavata]
MNISEVKTVQIQKFSQVTLQNFRTGAEFKIISNNCYIQAFEVYIFINYSAYTHRDGISAMIYEKWRKPAKAPVKNDLTWTFSVVDVHGDCKYSQSFITVNPAFCGYSMFIPNIFKRAVFLEQSDVFLPEDVLTLKIELTCPLYTCPLTLEFFRNAYPTGNSRKRQLMFDSALLFAHMRNALRYILMTRKRSSIDEDHFQLQPNFYEPKNDAHKKYLREHPVFQLFNALKRMLKKGLDESIPYSDDLLEKENNYVPELLYIYLRMKEIYFNSDIRFNIRKLKVSYPG